MNNTESVFSEDELLSFANYLKQKHYDQAGYIVINKVLANESEETRAQLTDSMTVEFSKAAEQNNAHVITAVDAISNVLFDTSNPHSKSDLFAETMYNVLCILLSKKNTTDENNTHQE